MCWGCLDRMVGERVKKWKWNRIPAILLIMLITARLLVPAGPAGAALGSPAERLELTAAAIATDAPPASEKRVRPETAAAPEESAPWGPVAESEAVEDTYFSDVVFLGDSRTEGFSLYSGLKEGTYLYGVGATVESVFTKKAWDTPNGKIPLLDALAAVECGKVYLMLGVNELGWSKVETFYDQYARVIDRIREDHPEAAIVLQSILPVSAKQDAKGSYVNNRRIAAYNEAIRALAAEKGCPLVDVAEAFTGEDGCLPPNLSFEGVHLNPAGCRIWLDYLRTHSVRDAE